MSGYLEDPELNREDPELNRVAFVNGWFRTGDIGSLDEDGFLNSPRSREGTDQQGR